MWDDLHRMSMKALQRDYDEHERTWRDDPELRRREQARDILKDNQNVARLRPHGERDRGVDFGYSDIDGQMYRRVRVTIGDVAEALLDARSTIVTLETQLRSACATPPPEPVSVRRTISASPRLVAFLESALRDADAAKDWDMYDAVSALLTECKAT